METRKCTKCKKEFPATREYFHKLKHGKYGLHSRCKTCANQLAREKRENPASVTRHEEDLPKQYIPNLNIITGKRYKFTVSKNGKGTETRTFIGKAIQICNNHIVFQTKNYIESFLKIDLAKIRVKEA